MRTARVGLALVVVLAGFSAIVWARGDDTFTPQKSARDASSTSTADKLVRDALAAEQSVDNSRRDKLLNDALAANPNCRAARWQLGFIQVDGKWITPQEAEKRYAADPNIAKYRSRRDEAVAAGLFSKVPVSTRSDTSSDVAASSNKASAVETVRSDTLSPAGVAAAADLARWCRSKRLVDEERAHWTQVLLNDSSNTEAQSRLGLHEYMGDLRTSAQIDALKFQIAVDVKDRAAWQARVSHWRRALDSSVTSQRAQASAEMRNVNDPAVIPALVIATWSDSSNSSAKRDEATPFQLDVVELLGRLSDQRATYLLTQLSVLAKQPKLRTSAAHELRTRNLHDFVPILLEALANPIELEYSTSLDASGLAISSVNLSEDQQHKNRVIQVVDTSQSPDNVFVGSDGTASAGSPLEKRLRANDRLADKVQRRNQMADEMDRRVNAVMECVTGQRANIPAAAGDSDVIPDSALASTALSLADFWWSWWDKYIEVDSYKPSEVEQYQFSTTILSPYATAYISGPSAPTSGTPVTSTQSYHWSYTGQGSCFPAGTTVSTLAGPMAIEKIQVGDCVLAQDPDSGELAYKPVVATTVRAPTELIHLTTSNGLIRLTRGHGLWVDGKGWRMAKELKPGDRLHGLHGATVAGALASDPAEPVYNLVVADFHTYFVGSQWPILVHDVSPRLPACAMIPGLVARDR